MVEWNKVTWYSRILALILFIAVIPAIAFYIGMQYQAAIQVSSPVSSKTNPLPKNSVASNCTETQCTINISSNTKILLKPDANGIQVLNPATKQVIQEIPMNQEYILGSPTLDDVSYTDDINFDGYKDLQVLAALGDSNGFYDYWIYDSTKGIFKKDPVLQDLANPTFDPTTKQIYTNENNGDVGLDFTAYTYKFENGSYQLIQSVQQQGDEDSTDDNTFSKKTTSYINGKEASSTTEEVCYSAQKSPYGEVLMTPCN